ncbi:MAG: citrate/2-methylcitrate synthase [Geodermatophilaceae bacterium]
MSGPLHGGAPARVLHMLEEIEDTGDADGYVQGPCWTTRRPA